MFVRSRVHKRVRFNLTPWVHRLRALNQRISDFIKWGKSMELNLAELRRLLYSGGGVHRRKNITQLIVVLRSTHQTCHAAMEETKIQRDQLLRKMNLLE